MTENRPRRFANGDVYTGGWANGLPHGEGKYVWLDGSCYDGGWKEGTKNGVGKYHWPSGAVYQGEWYQGCMHGIGTFESPDGSRYQGSWLKDLKHGLGKKVYANGDVYEGLWKHNKPDGPGRYMWADRNEYDGEWHAGKMQGQGTFVWKSGERYDGEWVDGQEEGLGVFTFRDGSTYDGFWKRGKKHGIGVLRPAPVTESRLGRSSGGTGPAAPANHSMPPDGPAAVAAANGTAAAPATAAALKAKEAAATAGDAGSRGDSEGGSSDFESGMGHGVGLAAHGSATKAPMLPQMGASAMDLAAMASAEAAGQQQQQQQQQQPLEKTKDRLVIIKEYDNGKLIRQSVLDASEVDAIFGKRGLAPHHHRHRGPTKVPPKQVTRMGEVLYKGHPSYDLMLQLQLGIRWTVTQMESEPMVRELTDAHFARKLKMAFPRDGTPSTPVHPSSDFIWKAYAPDVFRQLRSIFQVDAASYLEQLCRDQSLRLLSSPGKSGSVFLLSLDDKFLVKTIRKSEFKLLRRLLARYQNHMVNYPNSLLVRFYGLHRISTPDNGRKVRFVVMSNIFRTDLQIHQKYDLKGSTLGRTAGEDVSMDDPNVVLKDLDLNVCFKLEEGWHSVLMRQISADCTLLADCGIMDYSLLLGVHYRGREAGSLDERGGPSNFGEHTGEMEMASMLGELQKVIASRKLSPEASADLLALARLNILGIRRQGSAKYKRSPTAVLAMRPKRSATLRPVSMSAGGNDELAHSLGLTRVQLGISMAAVAVPEHHGGPSSVMAQDVVLYFGIIDILTNYDYKKRIESNLRAIVSGKAAISAVSPRYYAQRFQDFMKKIFL